MTDANASPIASVDRTRLLAEEILARTAVQRSDKQSEAYRFRDTVSYWIAVMFIEGSILFAIGAAASMFHNLEEWQETALVDCAYFAGAICFTTGAYLGWFEVINVGREGLCFVATSGTSVEGYYGSLSYFIGTLFYNVQTTAVLFSPDGWSSSAGYEWAVIWGATTTGGIFFTLAAIIELRHNRHATPRQLVFWLCWSYLLGSVLYLFGAAAAYPHNGYDHVQLDWLVNAPYLIGSLAFFVGAWVALYMWKAEQFGLGFIAEINHTRPADGPSVTPILTASINCPAPHTSEPRAAASATASPPWDAPCARAPSPHQGAAAVRPVPVTSGRAAKPVDWKQQPFLFVYVLLGATSILGICHAAAWQRHSTAPSYSIALDRNNRILSSLTVCLAAHAILWLATIVHRTPTMAPYAYLLWFMRALALMFLATSVTELAYFYTIPHDTHPSDVRGPSVRPGPTARTRTVRKFG